MALDWACLGTGLAMVLGLSWYWACLGSTELALVLGLSLYCAWPLLGFYRVCSGSGIDIRCITAYSYSVSINISNTGTLPTGIFFKPCTIEVLQRNSPGPMATCHFPRKYPTNINILKYISKNIM
jgi:hypothetical protein